MLPYTDCCASSTFTRTGSVAPDKVPGEACSLGDKYSRSDSQVYVAARHAGAQMIDITDPATPQIVGGVMMEATCYHFSERPLKRFRGIVSADNAVTTPSDSAESFEGFRPYGVFLALWNHRRAGHVWAIPRDRLCPDTEMTSRR